MSVSRVSPEERNRKAALARIKKKVSGGVFGMPKCAVCGREFTERELLAEDLVWAVGKAGSVQFRPACYRREFGRKEAKA